MVSFELRESLNVLFIKNSNLHEKNGELRKQLCELKDEKINWLQEKQEMALKIQKLELQLGSCTTNVAPPKSSIKLEPNIQPKTESPELQIQVKSEIKKEFLGRKLATATRKALCLICGADFVRNSSAKRHFKNLHADEELKSFATKEEIESFKKLDKKEPDEWLLLHGVKWDRFIKDDGSVFGRPKKTALKVATQKVAPEKENLTSGDEVATQSPTARG